MTDLKARAKATCGRSHKEEWAKCAECSIIEAALQETRREALEEARPDAEDAVELLLRVEQLEEALRPYVEPERPKGWLPGIGDVRQATVTEEEYQRARKALENE